MALSQKSLRVSGMVGLIAIAGTLSIGNFAAAADAPKTTVNSRSAIAKSVQVPEEKGWFEKQANRLGSLDIKFKVPLLDVELIKGLKTSLDYKYETEPSYTGDYHFRMDRATLKNELNVGELIRHTNRYVGLNLNHGTEILYVRPFPTKKEAILAIPFGFDHVPKSVTEITERLPFSAENTKNMAAGDFFSFTAHLDLVVSAASLPIAPGRLLGVYSHYLISGQYQVYLVKGEKDDLFLKVVALRRKEKAAGVRVGLWEGHRILGLKVIDRRIDAISNLTEMFKLEQTKSDANIFAVDYVLDMSDDRVREAYDGLAAKVLKFKSIAIGNPVQSIEDLADTLISDITPFDDIFNEDRMKPVERQAVVRNFQGRDDVISDSSEIKFSPILFGFSKKREYFENVLTSIQPDGKIDHYRLHTFQRTNSFTIFWSYFKGVGVSSASLLYDSGPKQKGQESPMGALRDIAFSWDYRDKTLTSHEMKTIRDAVAQAVPERINKTVNWGVFASDRAFENARFSYKMVLHPSALSEMKSLSQAEFLDLLKKHLPTIPTPTSEASDKNAGMSDGTQSSNKKTFFDTHYTDLNNIAFRLSQFVDPKLSNLERSRAFAELRFNDLFIELAPGFILSMLDQTKLDKLVRFEITMVADDVPAMTPFKFPKVDPLATPAKEEDRKVYNAASAVQSILTSNEFDTITTMLKTSGYQPTKSANK